MKVRLVKDILENSDVNLTHVIPMPRFEMVTDEKLHVQFTRPKMTHPQKAIAILKALYHTLSEGEEYVFLITLDKKLNFINAWIVGHGDEDSVQIKRKPLIRRITADDNAASWIVAHNHPSGSLKPSVEDFRMLKIMTYISECIETPLRDFIIFDGNSDEYYSHRDQVDKEHKRHEQSGLIEENCGLCVDESMRGL